MANEYLRINNTTLNIKKAENALAIIEEKRKDPNFRKDLQSESSLFEALRKAFKDFFTKLGKPTLQLRLLKKTAPARSADYNQTMREIVNDIGVAYQEEDALSNAIVRDFNYSEAERQMLVNKVKLLNSQSLDYSFYATGVKDKSLYGLDNFTDNAKIDFGFISSGENTAEILPNQGVITLKRVGNKNVASSVESIVGVKESIPAWDPSNESGGYEGLYFGRKNEVRPEGGRWHVIYSEDGTKLFEIGAIQEDLMPRRLQMFDDNPDTFWEVELISTSVAGYANKYSGEQISVARFNELVDQELNAPAINPLNLNSELLAAPEGGGVLEDYVPVTSSPDAALRVSFTAILSEAKNINWISLLPNNFGQEKYLEITSIQTSADGKSFDELEGFDDHEFDNVLTQEANSELTQEQAQSILSPDQFKFSGQGVWVFAPRMVRAIRFEIKQPKFYHHPYDVLMVETSQNITTTTTTKKWYGKKKESTDSQTIKKETEIPYLTGQVVGFDVMDIEPGDIDISASLAQRNDVDKSNTYLKYAKLGASFGLATALIPLGFVGSLIGGLIGALFGSKKKVETTIGPQTITRQWIKTKADRIRFAIGIRDINIYSHTFVEKSDIVSTPYLSPKPISKLTLKVDETIPKIFYTSEGLVGTENDWIKYYISVDNGVSWHRISPQHHRTTLSEDGIHSVPEVINVNSDVAAEDRKNPLAYIDVGEPVYEVRFKASLSRPTTIPDAESYTPVLSRYALQIYPFGGL